MERITAQPLALAPLLQESDQPECGGLAIFGGTVRNHHEGRDVERLKYTAYGPVAEKTVLAVEQEAIAKFGVSYCKVLHRIGELAVGDVAIYCVVRAPHRAEAFAACKYAVDGVKHRAPIWKEEFYTDGTSAFVEGCCINPEH